MFSATGWVNMSSVVVYAQSVSVCIDLILCTDLQELQQSESAEQNENVSEFLRMAGKPITYPTP